MKNIIHSNKIELLVFILVLQTKVWKNSLFLLNRNIGFICKRLYCNKKAARGAYTILGYYICLKCVYNNVTVYHVDLQLDCYNIVTDNIMTILGYLYTILG